MGVGLGGAPVSFALFLELVPSSARGILMVALQSFWTVGSMIEVRHCPMLITKVSNMPICEFQTGLRKRLYTMFKFCSVVT